MKCIELSHGFVAVVDDEDFDQVAQYRWCVLNLKRALKGENIGYAARTVKSKGKTASILMHRVIMGAGPDERVDHINGNPLDNRRCNLRLATHAQNMINSRKQTNNTSGYKGVWFDGKNARWCAMTQKDGKKMWLGQFTNPLSAAMAYDRAVTALHGEFARPNFPTHEHAN